MGLRGAIAVRGIPGLAQRVLATLLLAGWAAGCLAPGLAGPSRRLTFNTSIGPFHGRLAPLPSELTPLEKETYPALRTSETADLTLRAALLASGVSEPEALTRQEAAARAAFASLRPLVDAQSEPVAQARALLEAMHQRIFKAYAVDQTYLHVVLGEGIFNCVSASLLYNIYAGWLGYRTGISLLPSHARSFVDVGGRRIEVETTMANGFDPALTPEQQRAFLQLRALGGEFREQPSFKPNASLVALIIANRIAFRHDGVAGTSADQAVRLSHVVVALGLRAAALDPDDRVAWRNETLRLDRLAVLVISRRHFDDGLALQRMAARLTGDHGEAAERLRNNVAWGAQQHILAAKGDRAEIERALGDAKALIGCEHRAQLCAKLDDFARLRMRH